MSNINIINNGGRYIIKEGSEIKGGLNGEPTTPRPSEPPKGHRPPIQTPQEAKNI